MATDNPQPAFDPSRLDWDKGEGLLPVIVQDAATLRVLMLGYMNREALQATLASGRVTFFSRSKQRLWTKGESSGHVLELVSVQADCDDDTLLVLARPHGPTCHLQRASCFRIPVGAGCPGCAARARTPGGQLHHAAVRGRRTPHRAEGGRGGRGSRLGRGGAGRNRAAGRKRRPAVPPDRPAARTRPVAGRCRRCAAGAAHPSMTPPGRL